MNDDNIDAIRVFNNTKSSAKLGDRDAQFALADFYEKGIGTPHNHSEYLYWHERTIKNTGSPAFKKLHEMRDLKFSDAMKELENCGLTPKMCELYAHGFVVLDRSEDEKDYAEAFCWFKAAADMGDSEAITRVAYCYYVGEGVEKNLEKALEWYLKAAYSDDYVKCTIGNMYENGLGTDKDIEKAHYWYDRAASNWNPLANMWLREHGYKHY
jgi:TPR repeat protein